MNILITGGCCLLGEYLCKRLSKNGNTVVCVDNFCVDTSRHPRVWPDTMDCSIELQDRSCLDTFKYDQRKYDMIIHIASVKSTSFISLAENLIIDGEMYKWAFEKGINKIIYISSQKVYDTFYNKPESVDDVVTYSETDHDLINFKNINHDWEESIGEILAKKAHKEYGLNTVCYRVFNLYGEYQDDESPFKKTLKQILNKDPEIHIDSNEKKDYLYVGDAVDCIVNTMDKVNDGSSINICSGNLISTEDFAKKMMEITGYSAPIKYLDDLPIPMCNIYKRGNPAYAESLGWTPKTSLEEVIKRTIDYINPPPPVPTDYENIIYTRPY